MKFSALLQVFAPKDKKFMPFFVLASENLVKAAGILTDLTKLSPGDEQLKLIQEIRDLEHKGDGYTYEIFQELGRSFITPFDREDVHKLTSSIDNVLDFINSTCQRIKRFQPRELGPDFVQLSEIILEATKEIHKAIIELNNLKNPKAIEQACTRINSLENAADEIYHSAISRLFANEKDAIELIKKKEIIEALEKASDKAEDVSDVLKTIIIKAA
jgi:predicted phosphate transport protein (TIGR00153 family)